MVVESPTKVKTIRKYLDARYVVRASMGHLRDLPKSRLGVDVKNGFKPDYRTLPAKRKILEELKKSAQRADALYVATDPDREGEAIGWHLAQELPVRPQNVYRVMFNEITARAVRAAFEHPGRIDQRKVDAQQARRVLDRLVGYNLSPLLWRKVQRGLSAGRVQSVAVRQVVGREREIQAFVPVEYWSLDARLRATHPPEFVASLREVAGARADLPSEERVRAVMGGLEGRSWVVKAVTRGERKRNPAPPFITSTLQQEAGRKLRFSAKKTMLLAQQLYEGIEVGAEGPVGLITYMRTDSVHVSGEAQAEARQWIGARLGTEYLPPVPPVYRSKKGAQEAHEAIRPSDVAREPRSLTRFLTRDQLAIYRLIWERFLASQMLPAIYDTVAADIEAGDCLFRAQGSTLRFPGFTAVYVESREEPEPPAEEEVEAVVPPLLVGETLALLGLEPGQHFTQPPPRYTEASLIKLLEERGIGRPSTYAQIMSTIQERGYVRKEKSALHPTELGLHVTDFLVPLFPGIMDAEFTAQMEEDLDKIEEGATSWTATIQAFYKRFERELREAGKQEPGATGQACPRCGRQLLERWGRYGKFLACSGYPDCTFTQDVNGNGRGRAPEVIPGEVCERCGRPMVLKEGRYGKFAACQGYPECRNTRPLTTGIACPEKECGGQLVERRSRRGKAYYACSNYPRCTFVLWQRPVGEPCPRCGAPFLVERSARGKKPLRRCVRDGCDYAREAEVVTG